MHLIQLSEACIFIFARPPRNPFKFKFALIRGTKKPGPITKNIVRRQKFWRRERSARAKWKNDIQSACVISAAAPWALSETCARCGHLLIKAAAAAETRSVSSAFDSFARLSRRSRISARVELASPGERRCRRGEDAARRPLINAR